MKQGLGDPDDLIAIGRILRPRGIAGELKVQLLCDSFDDFCEIARSADIFSWIDDSHATGPSAIGRPVSSLEIESARFHDGFALVRFASINTMDEAEKMRGRIIGIRAAQLPDPGEDAFYAHDLEGLCVCNLAGEKIGEVVEAQDNPAHYLLKIQPDGPPASPYLIPFVEPFIRKVNLGKRTIVVDLPPGFAESQK